MTRWIQSRIRRLFVTILIFQCTLLFLNQPLSSTGSLFAEASEAGSDGSQQQEDVGVKQESAKQKTNASGSDADDTMDWGTFYDPNDVFCGKHDCYKILGFDYWTFQVKIPTMKEITKSYRSLSRKWHPDKNKQEGAKERFVAIAKAYKVLTHEDKRKEYDYMRERPDEYMNKYGSSVIWKYAPKSDARFVVVFLLVLLSVLSVAIQFQRWKTLADHMVKASVEDLGKREGGSRESNEIRAKGLIMLEEQELSLAKSAGKDAVNGSSKKKKEKVTKQEKKKIQKEELKKIVKELVYAIDDFGGGFSKPTYRDAFAVKLVFLPFVVVKTIAWYAKFYSRRVRGFPYNDEELEAMTKQVVGQIAWDACDEEEHEVMKTSSLWVAKNLEDWKEEQEMKFLSAGEKKQMKRLKKKAPMEKED